MKWRNKSLLKRTLSSHIENMEISAIVSSVQKLIDSKITEKIQK